MIFDQGASPRPRADRGLVLASAFLRSTATGACGVGLGLSLAAHGFSARELGIVVAAGLWGAALATGLVMAFAERVARRRCLAGLAALGSLGLLAAAHASSVGVAAAAAFFGMVNGMGRDRGASLVLEQAALPALGRAGERTRMLAWYSALQDCGHAVGALVPGAVALLAGDATRIDAPTTTLGVAGALLAATLVLALGLSPAMEEGRSAGLGRVSPRSRGIILRLAGLFAIDSVAGGFLTTALISYWFCERFGISAAEVGVLYFAARVLNAASHFAAAWLAARIGLVNTMVFTHLPSSLLLGSVAFAPTFPIAAGLFLLREGLVEMDVPTRQSYVLAVVEPEERTVATAATHLVRMAGWAVAPAVAGALMAGASPGVPLVVGAAMKIAYDLLLWRSFRNVRPPEEAR